MHGAADPGAEIARRHPDDASQHRQGNYRKASREGDQADGVSRLLFVGPDHAVHRCYRRDSADRIAGPDQEGEVGRDASPSPEPPGTEKRDRHHHRHNDQAG